MQPTSIAFAHGAFLVEVEPDFRDTRPGKFVVHLSLLEQGGNLLRPLVGGDGGRLVLHGRSEPHAFSSAIRFLAKHFGALVGPTEPWHPQDMEWGQPVVVES